MRVPDAILVPVGDGVIISGVYKAFHDLRAAGLCERLPRLVAVQAESSAAIHDYIVSGSFQAGALPRDHRRFDLRLRAQQSGPGPPGRAGERRIFASRSATSGSWKRRRCWPPEAGVFAEPAAAAAAAALLTDEARERLDPGWQIVLLVTGHGLKDIEAPLSRLRIPEAIPADIAALPEDQAEN